MTIRVDLGDISKLKGRLATTQAKMRDVAFFMYNQVEDRFRTQGASGGKPWLKKKMREWGYDDGRAILTGTTGILRKSFTTLATDTSATVGSWAPYSVVHQLGTVGKGGVLPTIKPKRAKALFIPVTDRAIKSVRFIGQDASAIRLLHKIAERAAKGLAYRAGVKESRKNRTTTFTRLVKGRLNKGKLQKWNERKGEYVDGTPDFIFLKKVDLPPRPMLPTSPQELAATSNFFMHRLVQERP